MRRRKKQWLLALGGTAILVVVVGVLAIKRHDVVRLLERSSLPEPIAYEEAVSAPILPTSASAPSNTPAVAPASTTTPISPLPKQVNLAVPFTAQAPHANWDDPYAEFCEEASVLMAISYITGKSIPNPDFAAQKMLEIKAFEEKRFGYYKDTTAAETAIIFQEFYKYKNVKVLDNPKVADIKQALAAGKLVVIPAAGRLLGNPYYTPPGPLYHMLVIKGYTADGKFITNDPGTRRGADFVYSEATIMNAIHDWRTDTKIELGKKVVIIVG